MKAAHYAKLWTQFGKYLVIIALATWSIVQGGPELFGASPLGKRPVIAALFGIVVCAPLLALVARIGSRFAAQNPAALWPGRIPVSFLKGLDVSTRDGKIYQSFFLVAFAVIPAAALLHFLRVVLNSKITERGGQTDIGHFDLGHIDWCFCDRYRIGEDDGVTYFPVVEPALLLLLCFVAWAAVAHLLFATFRKPAPGLTPGSAP
jgi:hypothetical protein